MTVTKKELTNRVHEKVYHPKGNCEEIIEVLFDEMKDALLNGEKISITNFLSLEPIEKDWHKGRDPQTGNVVEFPPHKTLRFRLSGSFKDELNDK